MTATARMKPSGLDWVDSIPNHWDTPALSARFEIQLGKMLNPEATSGDYLQPYLRNVNVQWDRVDLTDLGQMHFDAMDRRRYRLRVGDLLVCEGGEVGRAAIWDGELAECYYQKALHRIRARTGDSVRYLMYALMTAAAYGLFQSEGNTSTIVHLTSEKLRNHRLPWPPQAEQEAITRYLDRETNHLDALVAVRRRQLDLLSARRQALIDQWMSPRSAGQWDGVPLKRVVRHIEQGWSPQCENRAAEDGEWGVLKAGAANGGRFLEAENKALPPEVQPVATYEVREGDILISRANTRSLVASVCVVPRIRPRLLLCDKLFRLHPHHGIDRRFLAYALRTTAARADIEAQATGASDSMLNIGQDTIRELRVGLPDLAAQKHIADMIDSGLMRIDSLAQALTFQTELLKERRQALIAAAVTGQIEIPGVAA